MDFSESLALELYTNSSKSIIIHEGNAKAKLLNRKIKVGESFQYSLNNVSNRFIIWTIDNNVVHLVEHSTDFELIDNRLDISFDRSQVLSLNIFENEQAVEFLIATSVSVIRFSLHHPMKLRQPNNETYKYSIFYDVCDLNEIKHSIGNYFDITNVTNFTSTVDYINNDAYYNFALASGSIYTVVMSSNANIENVTYFEMTESSLLSKLFSGLMPRTRTNESFDISVSDMTYVEISNVIYLVTISKDNKLRIWNLKDRNCIATECLLSCVLEANNCSRNASTINQSSIISAHKIKSFWSDTNMNDYLDTVVVYFHSIFGKDTLSNWLVVRILDPSDRSSYNKPIQICSNITDAGDGFNLLDYHIGYDMKMNDTMGVWSLTSQSNVHSLHWVPLIEGKEGTRLDCRLYNGSNELDLYVPEHDDPQESIIAKVFSHHFSRMAIVNTINRNFDDNYQIPPSANIDEVKFRLVIAVEAKIEQQLSTYLEDDENIDVMELHRQQWSSIFQEIVQEHFYIMEPLGIISASGTIGLHRYGTVSLLRSSNGMEQILYKKSRSQLALFFDDTSLISGGVLLQHIHELSTALRSTESWPEIEHSLFVSLESPTNLCRLLSSTMNLSSVQSRFDSQPMLIEQAITVLETLDMDGPEEAAKSDQPRHLSPLSTAMLHDTACRIVKDRACMALALMVTISSRQSQSGSLARLTRLLRSLVSMHRLLTARHRPSLELTDVQKCQLDSLNLLDSRVDGATTSTDLVCVRVLQSLNDNCPGSPSDDWKSRVAKGTRTLLASLCPAGEAFPLIEVCRYFLSHNMPLELIDFLHTLTVGDWWSGDLVFVQSMIAIAHLMLGKPWKAVEGIIDQVQQADIASSLLPDVLLGDDRTDSESLSSMQSAVLIKIIDVIDRMDNPEPYIVTLARAGVKLADKNDGEHKSILMTILFKNLLEINKYDEARTAIIDNPDHEKQKDCLRQFVMVLCDNKELEKLVHFDYASLNDEFINIVSSRARSSEDLASGKDTFYQVLFSFQVVRGNLAAAAACMLDLGLHLDLEMRSMGAFVEGTVAMERLQCQMHAFLACMTTARLCTPELRHFTVQAELVDEEGDRNHDDDMNLSRDAKTVVLTMADVKARYELVRSRLRLLRDSPEHGFIQIGRLSPQMTLAGLLEIGLYSDAIKICGLFGMDLSSVVTTIATRCAQVSQNCLDRPLLKEKENVIDSLEDLCPGVDFESFGSLHQLEWRLLEEVLRRHDASPHGDLSLRACSRLLSSGVSRLPAWLVDLLVARQSSPALLRLLIAAGHIEAAVDLACRVITDRIDEVVHARQLHAICDPGSIPPIDRMRWFSYPAVLHLIGVLEGLAQEQAAAGPLLRRLADKFGTMIDVVRVESAPRLQLIGL